MFNIISIILLSCVISTASAFGYSQRKLFPPIETIDRVLSFSDKTNTTAERAQYVKELYYSVNGYPAGTDTSFKPQPHLELFNQAMGSGGVGGVLYSSGYKTCDAIPTTGSTSGTSQVAGTLNLTFSAGTKTIPSYYPVDASSTMDKRIAISGNVAVELELKCNTDATIQTGYVKFTYTQYDIVYEGYFQQNSTTGAINVDMYVKTQTGGGINLLIPTQFVTTNGESFSLYSAYIYPDGGGRNYIVAVNGVANGDAQVAFLETTDTAGGPVTTAPHNFGNLSTAGGTVVAVECIDITNETLTTGCSAITAPGSLVIGGTTSTWTVNSLSAVSL